MSEGYFVLPTQEELELAHHGILGQRWGIRRYQNADGSLTPAGLKRYGSKENYLAVKKASAESEAYAIRSKAKLKAAKEEAKVAAKIKKQQDKEDLKVAKKLKRIEEKSNKKDDRRDNRQQSQYQQNYNQQNYQQGGQPQYYQSQGKPNAAAKFIKAAKNSGITNMVMDVGTSTLKKYAFKKLDEAMLSPGEKMIREYDSKLRQIVAKNNLMTARIDERALNDSYSNYDNWSSGQARTHQQTWQNLRGGQSYRPDYQNYNKNKQQNRDNDRR